MQARMKAAICQPALKIGEIWPGDVHQTELRPQGPRGHPTDVGVHVASRRTTRKLWKLLENFFFFDTV